MPFVSVKGMTNQNGSYTTVMYLSAHQGDASIQVLHFLKTERLTKWQQRKHQKAMCCMRLKTTVRGFQVCTERPGQIARFLDRVLRTLKNCNYGCGACDEELSHLAGDHPLRGVIIHVDFVFGSSGCVCTKCHWLPNHACLCCGVISWIFCGPLAIRIQLFIVSYVRLCSCTYVR